MNKSCKSNQQDRWGSDSHSNYAVDYFTIKYKTFIILLIFFLQNSSFQGFLSEIFFFIFIFFGTCFSKIVSCFYKNMNFRLWFLYSLPILFVRRKKYKIKNKTFYYKNITLFVMYADVFYQNYRKDCFFISIYNIEI